MKQFVTIFISIYFLSLSYAIGQSQDGLSEDSIKSFITKMYNEKLYEDYDFLQKHCSPELLKKLLDAYPYDSDDPAYATWLFRSGRQDDKPGSDGKTMMLDVEADGDWYVYTALDMGWEFASRIKVTCKDGKFIIEDVDMTSDGVNAVAQDTKNADHRYLELDERPSFKGGSPNDFAIWVTKHVRYPKYAKEIGIEGTVMVRFVIDTNGKISEAHVHQGVHPLLDEEAVRVVMKSPNWKPAKKDGKPVRVSYTMPVVFSFR